MNRPLLWVVLVVMSSGGCVPRGRVNAACAWSGDAASPIDPRAAPGARHLRQDAELAEELAIRYADATRGSRSGHYAGADEYRRARDHCMDALFDTIARTHGVDAAVVRAAIGNRPAAFDAVVLASFALVYVLAAAIVASALARRFPRDEPIAAAIAVVMSAAAAAMTGVMAFALWSAGAEMIRIGNAHMSYRAGRVPWSHHLWVLYAGGVGVFVAAAAIRYGAALRAPAPPTSRP
jgi:hypothetical protein